MDKLSEKIKKILNQDKKTSNLILIIILLVILLIAVNYIFNSDKENGNEPVKQVVKDSETNVANLDVESKLENILSKIEGIKEVNVMLTYSETERIIPVYDIKENVDTSTTEEKKEEKSTTEKTVAYEDSMSGKVAIVESKETAVASGAIIVAKGNITENMKAQLKEAVSAITNVPIHKIQVFGN